jgi:hypothetical protein
MLVRCPMLAAEAIRLVIRGDDARVAVRVGERCLAI